MDLIVLISIFIALLVVLVTLFYFKNKGGPSGKKFYWCLYFNHLFNHLLESEKPVREAPAAAAAGPQLVRNQRRTRVRAAEPQAPQAQAQAQQNDSDDDAGGIEIDEKMGAKKRAKLEAKAEKRAQREAELKQREEQKKRDGEKLSKMIQGVEITFYKF